MYDLYNPLFAEEKPQGSSWSRSEGKAMEKQELDKAKKTSLQQLELPHGRGIPSQPALLMRANGENAQVKKLEYRLSPAQNF